MVDDHLAEEGTDAGKLRKFRIATRAKKRDRREYHEHRECGRGVAPGAPEGLRKVMRKEPDRSRKPVTIGPINSSMSPDYQAIEVIDKARVARFGARNRQIRSGPPIDAAQLAHFFAMQLAQGHAIEKLQQLLEPLPDVLAFVDEAIDGHVTLPIANCQFPIFDFQSKITRANMEKDKSAIGNQKSAMLIECVPNFSEGRKADTVDRIARAVESVKGAVVLNRHIDFDHNRSVITFVGEPRAIVDAAVIAVATAKELIDLRHHAGVHPRIGATDVLPFVPVSGVTMDECVKLAHEAGRRIWDELSIPVYFYERAALRPDRVRLENVRGKGFESLREEIRAKPDRAPDVGEPKLHETAGAIAVGARPFLIAFNVNLLTNDLSIARSIAREVRERDGGLPSLKALAFDLQSRGVVQVSMNLVDYEQTGIARAFEAVHEAAVRRNVKVLSTEIVGLVPRAALDRQASYFPLLENFHETVVIESLLASLEKSRE